MTPQGHSSKRCPAIQALSHRLRSAASHGPVKFAAFLANDEFRDRFNSIPPALRRRAIQAIVEAEVIAARLDRLPPPVKAQRMGDGVKKNWRNPVQLAKLAKVYAVCGDDHEKAGRMLRVTAASARLARKRYLNAPATQPLQKAA